MMDIGIIMPDRVGMHGKLKKIGDALLRKVSAAVGQKNAAVFIEQEKAAVLIGVQREEEIEQLFFGKIEKNPVVAAAYAASDVSELVDQRGFRTVKSCSADNLSAAAEVHFLLQIFTQKPLPVIVFDNETTSVVTFRKQNDRTEINQRPASDRIKLNIQNVVVCDTDAVQNLPRLQEGSRAVSGLDGVDLVKVDDFGSASEINRHLIQRVKNQIKVSKAATQDGLAAFIVLAEDLIVHAPVNDAHQDEGNQKGKEYARGNSLKYSPIQADLVSNPRVHALPPKQQATVPGEGLWPSFQQRSYGLQVSYSAV